MSLFQPSFVQVFDNTGNPINGAKWKFFLTGTSTPTNVYSDAALTSSLGSVVTSDSVGRFNEMYINDLYTYRAVLTDASDITILDIDPYNSKTATVVTTRTSLQALSVSIYNVVYLTEAGREGQFVWKTGDYSAFVTSDPLQGIYVPANSNLSGSTGCWVREWDGVNGKVEWFGAISNSISGSVPANNVTAIHSALVLCPVVLFEGKDYYVNSTIKHNYANTKLKGTGGKYDSANGLRGTRIITSSSSTQIVQFGPDSNPGSISLMRQNVGAEGIYFSRSVAPSVPAAVPGILAQYILEAYFDDVSVNESMTGWAFNGTVHTKAHNCAAYRSSAGTGGTDSWVGFDVIGTSGIAAGGNASLTLSYCHADDNRTTKTNSTGFRASNKFTDCWWEFCETVSCTSGMEVAGNGATTNDYGSNDLTIVNPRNDASAVFGLYIHDVGVSGAVEVLSPYSGPAAGATAGVKVKDSYGVRLSGGQMIMGVATTANGIIFENTRACSVQGTIINEATLAAMVVNGAESCFIAPVIKNKVTTGAEAVHILGTVTGSFFQAIAQGKTNAFTYGYRVNGTADDRNEYNCTGINSACLNGGSGKKLDRNAGSITAAYTLTGTNTTSGVMT